MNLVRAFSRHCLQLNVPIRWVKWWRTFFPANRWRGFINWPQRLIYNQARCTWSCGSLATGGMPSNRFSYSPQYQESFWLCVCLFEHFRIQVGLQKLWPIPMEHLIQFYVHLKGESLSVKSEGRPGNLTFHTQARACAGSRKWLLFVGDVRQIVTWSWGAFGYSTTHFACHLERPLTDLEWGL